MTRRILAMLMAMAMVFSVLPAGVFAEGENNGGSVPSGNTVGAPAGEQLPTSYVPHDASAHICEHCDKTVTWQPWGDNNETTLPTTDGGHYYLTKDITVTVAKMLSGTVTLCLNGKTVTATKGKERLSFG